MSKAWYMDDACESFEEDCHFNPPKFVTLEKLKETAGVEYYQVNTDDMKNANEYWQLRKDRGYVYEDNLVISKKMLTPEEYEAKLKLYHAEHLHDDEEVRLFLEGSGYFDVRDKEDNWIRIRISKNDLYVIPAGTYHRFTPDKEGYVKVHRLFSDFPIWTAKFRPEAVSELRQQNLDLSEQEV